MSDLISELKKCTICTNEFRPVEGNYLIKGDRLVCQHCLKEGNGEQDSSLLLG